MIYFLTTISFILSLVFCYFLKRVGGKYSDKPIEDFKGLKIHEKPISFLGGLSMIVATIAPLFLKMALGLSFNWQIFGIITGGFLIFLLGFWDDFKWKKTGCRISKKFLSLILFSIFTAIILLTSGIKIQFFSEIILVGFLTFFYILGLINAVNLEDGIDGLAGGLVAISLIGFIVLSIILGNNMSLIISLILLGAILGFLIFNFPPAKIFMGDSGAYFLGFNLAVLAMIFSQPYNFKSFFVPILIIGLPIFDTGLAIIRRLSQKKSPFLGDRGHFYDKMMQRGFSMRKTVLVSYFCQLIFVALAIVIYLYA